MIMNGQQVQISPTETVK